jgi:hypothetical protein
MGNQLTPRENYAPRTDGIPFFCTTRSDQHQEGTISDPEELGQERATSSDAGIETTSCAVIF